MNNQRLSNIVDIFSFICIIGSILFLPIFFDHTLVNFYIIPKQYVLAATVLVLLLLWIIKAVITRKLMLRFSILDKPLFFMLLLSLVSAIFSVSVYDSFWGRGEYYVFNFIFLLFSILYYFFIINTVHSRMRWCRVLDAVVLVGAFSILLFLLRSIFNPAWLTGWWGGGVWNTIDGSNGVFGLWMVVIFILSAGRLIKKDSAVGKTIFNLIVAILSLIGLIGLGFNFLWWILLGGLTLLLFLGISFLREARLWWLSSLFAGLVIVAVFIIFGSPRWLQVAVPAELTLGIRPSWQLTTQTTLSGVKNFLVGSGLGTFGYDFARFRSPDFNHNSLTWSLRFNQPFSSFLSVLSEGGVLLLLAFVFLFLFVLGNVLLVWYKMRMEGMLRSLTMDLSWRRVDIRLDIFLAAIAWVLLSVGLCLSYFGPALWWLWWLLLALVMSGMGFLNSNIITAREWEIEDTPQYSLSFSFLMIVAAAMVVMTTVMGVRVYVAEKLYAEAVRSPNVIFAESRLKDAINHRANVDVYHALLSQVYMLRAGELSKNDQPDLQVISALVAQAVNAAKRATEISPNSVAIWENLALMYENAALLLPEARDWAIKSLLHARSLEPNNPILSWRLGNNYRALEQWEDAIDSYQSAIDLKNDYVGAYAGLAVVYEQNKQFDQAVEVYQKILALTPPQADLLYNFGRALYNRNSVDDREEAEKNWLRAVELEPQYSNALYSLGLLYENKGNYAKALQYYYQVKELNPDNKDVAAKIKSLVSKSRAAKK